jgi:hypothetical protein
MNLTITWDFPSFTFPIICDLPMSCKFISSPSLSLHTLRISSSVLTGCLTLIKTHVDAHVNPLIETVNKQQQTITEQAQTLSK